MSECRQTLPNVVGVVWGRVVLYRKGMAAVDSIVLTGTAVAND